MVGSLRREGGTVGNQSIYNSLFMIDWRNKIIGKKTLRVIIFYFLNIQNGKKKTPGFVETGVFYNNLIRFNLLLQ